MSVTFLLSFHRTTLNQSLSMNRYLPGYSRLRLHQPRLHQVVRPLSRPVSTVSAANAQRSPDDEKNAVKTGEHSESKDVKKTMAQLDEELRLKLEGAVRRWRCCWSGARKRQSCRHEEGCQGEHVPSDLTSWRAMLPTTASESKTPRIVMVPLMKDRSNLFFHGGRA